MSYFVEGSARPVGAGVRCCPGERQQARRRRWQLKKVLADNPLESFEPYPKQAKFLAAREQKKAFFGGTAPVRALWGLWMT